MHYSAANYWFYTSIAIAVQSIRAEVISMVRVAMRSSDYLQTTVLNAWVGLASDLYSAQEVLNEPIYTVKM